MDVELDLATIIISTIALACFIVPIVYDAIKNKKK